MAKITKFNRYSIIYVDDEAKARKYFELIFRDTYQVMCAESVDSALTMLEENAENVALLITDQNMPKTKGMDLLKIAKFRYPQISRMLTTAYTDIESAIESVNKGEIYRFVLKPWNLEEFRLHINQALQSYTDRKDEQFLLSERRQSLFKVASNIAHELRTPLAGIYATVNGIQDDFPELVKGYESAAAETAKSNSLSNERLKIIMSAFYNIERQVRHSQAMITILLENIRSDDASTVASMASMRYCLEEAIETYPFFKQQLGMVEVTGIEDFDFTGNSNAMINVFHNLLKNALYALQASKKTGAKISITLAKDIDQNQVYFRDEGTGIPYEILPFIFDDFYSSKGQSSSGLPFGNGIGLAFCKRALNSWSADIECHSVPGEFTEFILRFPSLAR